MTRTMKVLLATGAVALGGLTLAGASFADGGWGGHRGGYHGMGGGGQHGMGGGAMRMFEMFDANSDGSVSQAEVDQVLQERLTTFDADGDGALTLEEYSALWMDAMREHMVDRFQAHDDDGDGMVTIEEFGERFDRMVSWMDRDGDGAVSRDELGQHRRGGDRDDDDDEDDDRRG